MECQDEMVEMESQEVKARGETLVSRDHLACQVCMHFNTYISILIINTAHRKLFTRHCLLTLKSNLSGRGQSGKHCLASSSPSQGSDLQR